MDDKDALANSFQVYQDFIVAEYNYMADAAHQAQENRVRCSEYFIVVISSFITAIFAFRTSGGPNASAEYSQIFALLFLIIFVIGACNILQLCKLRLAWHESVMAMNDIKEGLIQAAPGIAPLFAWRKGTVLHSFKPFSISFILAVQISFLSGIAFAAFIYFCYQSKGDKILTTSLVATAVIVMVVLLFLYSAPLIKENAKNSVV